MAMTPKLALLLCLFATWVSSSPQAKPAPSNLPEPVTLLGYDGDAMEPFVTRDGEYLFFNNRNGPKDQTDLHWAQRINDLAFRYRGRVDGANSAELDGVPSMSAAGRFCHISTRAYRETLATVFCGTWREGRLTGSTLQTKASPHVPGDLIFDAEVSASGNTLVVAQGRFRGAGFPQTADLRQARWNGVEFILTPGDDHLFARLNTKALEYAPALSANGLTLAFTRLEGSGPFARSSFWLAKRKTTTEPFGVPIKIKTDQGFVEAPTFSADGTMIYDHRRIAGRYSIWRVRVP